MNAEVNTPWMRLNKEATIYAHKGPRYLRKEVKAGRLRAAQIGGRGEYVTRREWLDEWIERQATPVPIGRLR